MSQVTVTDIKDVKIMEKSEILEWIEMHVRTLHREAIDGKPDRYHDCIVDDLKTLREEYKTR